MTIAHIAQMHIDWQALFKLGLPQISQNKPEAVRT